METRSIGMCLWLAFLVLCSPALVLAQGTPAGSTATGPRIGEITGSKVRARTGESLNHHAFTTLPLGAEVIVTKRIGDWYEIHVPPYVPCWIHGDYLQAADNNLLQVTGSSVRLRSTPGTTFDPIGTVNRGALLRPTGKRNESGSWVEVYAPIQARAWVNADFVKVGRAIPRADLARTFVSLKRPSLGTPGKEVAGKSGEAAPKPAGYFSPRLRRINQQIYAERRKKPAEWNFQSVLAELRKIETTSEDLGEIEMAKEMTRFVQKDLMPIQAGFEKAGETAVAARRGVESGKKMEIDSTKAVHKFPTDAKENKYLAVGWVVGLGKHRKVEGTHMLKKGNKLLFYLKSDTLDLDKFVNRRVGVQGTLKDQPASAGARLIQVTRLEQLSR